MNNKSTNTNPAPQATGTVMGFQTIWNSSRINFYILFLCAMAILSPFLHMLYLIEDREGIFGYAYMSSFLFSISLPIMALSSGLLLKFAANHIIDEFKKPLQFISHTFIFVGFFFAIYILMPIRDYSITTYYVTLLVLAVLLTIVANYIHKAIITTEERLKNIISKLFDFIILETPRKHVSEEKQIDYVISYEKIINEIGEE